MQFGTFPSNFPNLCYSSSRGDTLNSNVWHSKCNDKGKTIYFVKVVYSNVEYNIGSYQRETWAGGGYYNDAEMGLFQLTPNVHKFVAGAGPHSGSGNAMYRSNNYGPTYGAAHDWYVSSNMRTGYAQFGHTYKCRTGNYGGNACRSDFIGSYSSWSISEQEMWAENF